MELVRLVTARVIRQFKQFTALQLRAVLCEGLEGLENSAQKEEKRGVL